MAEFDATLGERIETLTLEWKTQLKTITDDMATFHIAEDLHTFSFELYRKDKCSMYIIVLNWKNGNVLMCLFLTHSYSPYCDLLLIENLKHIQIKLCKKMNERKINIYYEITKQNIFMQIYINLIFYFFTYFTWQAVITLSIYLPIYTFYWIKNDIFIIEKS